MAKQRNAILISAVICTIIMMLIDGIVKPPYMIKSIIKIIVFGISILIFKLLHKENLLLFKIRKESFLKTILLAVSVYLVIILGYFLTRPIIDYSNITDTLTSTIGVSRENFIYVSLYISFINSLLEEIFFRGYCYLILRRFSSEKFSFLFSGAMFALYHGGMLTGWFHIGIYLLILALLMIAGFFFNMLDNKADSVLPSWLPHMFANFGINTVGFMLFGLI